MNDEKEIPEHLKTYEKFELYTDILNIERLDTFKGYINNCLTEKKA